MSYILKDIKKIKASQFNIKNKLIENFQDHQMMMNTMSNSDFENDFYSEFQDKRFGEIALTGNDYLKTNQLVKKCKVSLDSSSLSELMQNPVGMNTIFNQWYRFSHFTDGQNLSTSVHTQARNCWSYNSSTDAIYTNLNSEVYTGFVSQKSYMTYYLKVRFNGDDNNNNMIGIILAFMTDNQGIEHTLSLVRCKMIEDHTHYRYALIYDYLLNTEFKLMDKEDYIKDVSGSWNDTFVVIEAKRSNSTIEMCTSQIGNSNLDPLAKMVYTLPETQPAEYPLKMYQNLKKMLLEPAQIGFSAFSETGHFTVLEQKYVFDDNKIYHFQNDTIYEYKSNQWKVYGKISENLDQGILYSVNTNSLYKYMEGTIEKLT